MPESTQLPACPRCELERLTMEHIANIDGYIAAIPPETATDSDTLSCRLALCAPCPANNAGLCGYCGCFVRIRASLKDSYCPAPTGLW